MDQLTEAARVEAVRFVLSEVADLRDEMLEYAGERESRKLNDEMLRKHLVVSSTPRGRAVAVLTLPGTVDVALNIWIATVEAQEARDGIEFNRELVRLTDIDDVLNAVIPALREHFTEERDRYGASLYLRAALGGMTPAYVERLRAIAKDD